MVSPSTATSTAHTIGWPAPEALAAAGADAPAGACTVTSTHPCGPPRMWSRRDSLLSLDFAQPAQASRASRIRGLVKAGIVSFDGMVALILACHASAIATAFATVAESE